MGYIASTVRYGLEQRGWQVRALETDPLSARLIVADSADGEEREVDILKEVLWRSPARTAHGLLLPSKPSSAPRFPHWPIAASRVTGSMCGPLPTY